jgi:pimeloyl-ACP methyl ester carboxylesterase
MLLRAIFPNRIHSDVLFDLFLVSSLICVHIILNMPALFLIVIGFFFIRLYISVMEYFIFQRPEKYRKNSLEENGWSRSEVFIQGCRVQFYQNIGEKSKPAILFLHGWRSSASRMIQRMKYFTDHGWSVIAVDLPNHGSSDAVGKWSAEFSTSCVIDIINATKSEYSGLPFFVYGHSMGGFIGLRLCQRASEWSTDIELNSIIFESPMTKYSLILEETYRILRIPRIIRSVLDRRILTTVSRLQTVSMEFASIQQADIPQWGIPHVPSLILQAEHDARLGREHYNALIGLLDKHSLDYESHLISSLSHTGSDENYERTKLLETFLENRTDSSFFR